MIVLLASLMRLARFLGECALRPQLALLGHRVPEGGSKRGSKTPHAMLVILPDKHRVAFAGTIPNVGNELSGR